VPVARTLCRTHYERWRTKGDPGDDTILRGRKGGYRIDKRGYAYTYYPEHPNATASGNVAIHTVVMSEYLGRYLLPGEEVHHKNGIKDDNRPENLELWTRSQPPGQRVSDKIAWAIEFLEQYGYDVSQAEEKTG
jgi:hypothetical protein